MQWKWSGDTHKPQHPLQDLPHEAELKAKTNRLRNPNLYTAVYTVVNIMQIKKNNVKKRWMLASCIIIPLALLHPSSFSLLFLITFFFLMWAKIVEVTWRQYDKVKVRSSAALPAICASACVRIKKAPTVDSVALSYVIPLKHTSFCFGLPSSTWYCLLN